jgi:hypothetical protein
LSERAGPKQSAAKQASMVCPFCRVDIRPRALVCAACGAGIHYGPKMSDVLFYGALFAASASVIDFGVFKSHPPVPTVALWTFIIGAAFGVWRYWGKIRFRRYIP